MNHIITPVLFISLGLLHGATTASAAKFSAEDFKGYYAGTSYHTVYLAQEDAQGELALQQQVGTMTLKYTGRADGVSSFSSELIYNFTVASSDIAFPPILGEKEVFHCTYTVDENTAQVELDCDVTGHLGVKTNLQCALIPSSDSLSFNHKRPDLDCVGNSIIPIPEIPGVMFITNGVGEFKNQNKLYK